MDLRIHPHIASLGRGAALFLGGFTLLNLLGDLLHTGFNMNHWWIDFYPLSGVIPNLLLLGSSLIFLAFALKPGLPRALRYVAMAATGFLLLIALENVITYYVLLERGHISTLFPLPFSLLVSLLLGLVLASLGYSLSHELPRHPVLPVLAVLGVCWVLFPLGQIYCLGKTDYRRKGDVAVIFGARVYSNGAASDALKDRVATGIALYREGRVRYLIMSGGPGDGSVHETEAMKRMALKQGVPESAILTDPQGLSTEKTVHNTLAIIREKQFNTVLVVSHFYHLPRIRMEYRRNGRFVYSVPAVESYTLTQMPFFVAREMAALLYYYLIPLKP